MYISFAKDLFLATPPRVDNLNSLKICGGVTQSLGWWYLAHNWPSTLLYSIPYGVLMWIYEFSNETNIYWPQTWHGISHAPQIWTYYVFKEEYFQIKWYPSWMFLQGGKYRYKPNKIILLLPSHIMWSRSYKHYI